MKIPLEWLKEYVEINKSPNEIGESLTCLGLMLDKPSEGTVLDLEHRMDRSDWLSIIGCARDLAVFEKKELKVPKLYTQPGLQPKKGDEVEIKVECPDLVNRFNTRVFKNITVKPSPEWLRKRLESYGMPSINNIVDITNYVMIEFGQPMHAQDLSKFDEREITIRRASSDEKFTTLLGENVDLDPEIFVLTQNNKPIAIGGIVGGKITGIDENTKEIILDSGNYNQNHIRKTARRIKIQNETVLRYDKFLNPVLTEYAIQRATQLILDLAGGEYYQNVDWYPNPVAPRKQTFRTQRLKLLSGMDFETKEIERILVGLEYKILEKSEGSYILEVPYFRTDVEVEDDVVADILRLSNYTIIPSSMLEKAPPKDITQDIYWFEDKIRDVLVSLGLHEHITDPLVKKELDIKNQVCLENSQNSEKNALRTSVKDTLLPVLEVYKKHKTSTVGLLEVGKVYFSNNTGESVSYSDLLEERVVETLYWNKNFSVLETLNEIKKILSSFLSNLGITNYELRTENNKTSVVVEGDSVGTLNINSFAIKTQKLMSKSKTPTNRVISDLDNFRTEDISINININESFGPIFQKIKAFSPNIHDVEVIEEFQKGETQKSILVRITYKDNLDLGKLRSSLSNP